MYSIKTTEVEWKYLKSAPAYLNDNTGWQINTWLPGEVEVESQEKKTDLFRAPD